ncbi:MAG: radical SAM protein [Pseudomonadota bacterium]
MASAKQIFHVFLIKPSRYDWLGYPIVWWRSTVPSNSLACLYGLTLDCAERKVLGEDVEFKIWPQDEANARVRPDKLIEMAERVGGKAICCLVGVQSNQFPRSVDIARPFLDAGIPVVVGGFHVSGCISMLKELPVDLVEAREMGISFYLGEAEEARLDDVFIDAWAGKLQESYGSVTDLPDLQGAPIPYLPKEQIDRSMQSIASLDMGRGCPFQCSFCSIINVQGRKSRFRSGEDLEAILRANWRDNNNHLFITDDNFARNRNWEEIFDTMIRLREEEGIRPHLAIQVDTLCHRVPGFIDKAAKAGVTEVFVGLENINPANLIAAKKRQNRINEYREMFLAWKKQNIFITCGYIVGFPHDTRETVLRDVEIIKNELPIDTIYFSHLTPLPGSEDHARMVEKGEWMDPDMNKYSLTMRVCDHPLMSGEEWDDAVYSAYRTYYTRDHMKTVIRRMFGTGGNRRIYSINRLAWQIIYGRGPFRNYRLEGGIIPLRYRKDRRPGLPIENPLIFYPRKVFELLYGSAGLAAIWLWLFVQMKRIAQNPAKADYRDLALTPPEQVEAEDFGLLTQTTGAADEAQRNKDRVEIITAAKKRAQQAAAAS